MCFLQPAEVTCYDDKQQPDGAEGGGEESAGAGAVWEAAEAVGVHWREVTAVGPVGGGGPRAGHPPEAVDRHLRDRQAGGARLRRRRLLLLRRAPAQQAQVQLPRRAAPRHPRVGARPAQRRQRQGRRGEGHARAVDARLPPLMVAATASAAADGRSSAGEGASALLDDNTDGMDGENLVTRAVDERSLCSIDAEEVTGESTDVRATDSWQAL